MKEGTYLAVLMFLLVLVNASCEKESNSASARLRIVKIADNQAMENPLYNFEYNAQNLLVKISSESQYSAFNTEITYSTNKLPIKLTTTCYYLGDIENVSVSNIQWINNGFVVSDENDIESGKDIYELDAKGRIIKSTNIYTPQDLDPDTTVIIPDWIGEEELNISEYSSSYKFVKKNNPLSGINLAIVIAAELEYGEWEVEFQNNFCISEWDEGGLSAVITYQFNEQNYPLVEDIKYTSEEGTMHDYYYFEYESY
jgi:hypothetical protein